MSHKKWLKWNLQINWLGQDSSTWRGFLSCLLSLSVPQRHILFYLKTFYWFFITDIAFVYEWFTDSKKSESRFIQRLDKLSHRLQPDRIIVRNVIKWNCTGEIEFRFRFLFDLEINGIHSIQASLFIGKFIEVFA